MDSSELLTSICEALESLNASRLAGHYAESAEFIDAADAQLVKGKVALLGMYERLFSVPATRFTVTSAFIAEDQAAIEWIWEADNPETGEHRSVSGASIIRMQEGEISRETIYYDGRQAPV